MVPHSRQRRPHRAVGQHRPQTEPHHRGAEAHPQPGGATVGDDEPEEEADDGQPRRQGGEGQRALTDHAPERPEPEDGVGRRLHHPDGPSPQGQPAPEPRQHRGVEPDLATVEAAPETGRAPGVAAGRQPGDHAEDHPDGEREFGGVGDPPPAIVHQARPGEPHRRFGGQRAGERPEEREEREGQGGAGGTAAGDLRPGTEGGEGEVGADTGAAGERLERPGDGDGGDHPDERRHREQHPEQGGGAEPDQRPVARRPGRQPETGPDRRRGRRRRRTELGIDGPPAGRTEPGRRRQLTTTAGTERHRRHCANPAGAARPVV